MKRIFSWVLALSLVCSMLLIAPAGCAEMTPLEATLTNSFGRQESEWMESGITRATLYCSLIIDLAAFANEELNKTYFSGFQCVGRDGNTLVVYSAGEENDLMIQYYPSIESAYYSFVDKASESDLTLNTLLSRMCKDGYYRVGTKDRTAAMEVVEKHIDELRPK